MADVHVTIVVKSGKMYSMKLPRELATSYLHKFCEFATEPDLGGYFDFHEPDSPEVRNVIPFTAIEVFSVDHRTTEED